MSAPFLQARFTITSISFVSSGPNTWMLSGDMFDSAFDFTPGSVQVGDVVFDEGPLDHVVNRWRITSIVSTGTPNWNSLSVNVVYDESGSPGGLFGEPQPSDAALCRLTSNTNVAQRPTQGWCQLNETLLNYVRNIDIAEMIAYAQPKIDWARVTSNTLAEAFKGFFVDSAVTAVTITLPTSPLVNDVVAVCDVVGAAETNAITINSNGNKIEGVVQNKVIISNKDCVFLTYSGSTEGWVTTGLVTYSLGQDFTLKNVANADDLVLILDSQDGNKNKLLKVSSIVNGGTF